MNKIKLTKENRNEEFIIAHADVIDWWCVSREIDIKLFSDDFFLRFQHEINWYHILNGNLSITTEFAHKFEKQIGSKRWYLNGKTHREGGPAVIWKNGTEEWYLNGKLHREDVPAVIYEDGSKSWFLNGVSHREDGPAVIYKDEHEYWYINGLLHREDGPAIEWKDGTE